MGLLSGGDVRSVWIHDLANVVVFGVVFDSPDWGRRTVALRASPAVRNASTALHWERVLWIHVNVIVMGKNLFAKTCGNKIA